TAVSGMTSAIRQPSAAQTKKLPEYLPFIRRHLLFLARRARLGHSQRAQHLDPEEKERSAVLADEDKDRVAGEEAHHVLRGRAEEQHVEAVHADEAEEVDVELRDDPAVDLHVLRACLLVCFELGEVRGDAAFRIEYVVAVRVDLLRLLDERLAAGFLVRRIAGRPTAAGRGVSGHAHLHRRRDSGSPRRWTRSGGRAALA